MPDPGPDNQQSGYSQGALFEESTLFAEVLSPNTTDRMLESILALASIKGVGIVTISFMFDKGILPDLWTLGRVDLAQQLKTSPGKHPEDLAETIVRERERLQDIGAAEAEKLIRQGIFFLPIGHEDYPHSLLRLPNPPRWLFAEGNLSAIASSPIIGVIGSRKASPEGLRLSYHLGKELVARNIIVLSGLAEGIDEQAHQGAVESYGQSIAVLGHGISSKKSRATELLSRRIVRCDGAVVSEYLPHEYPSRQRYLRRNELQAALSQIIVPVECPSLASGTGATIRRALKVGTKLIGVVPSTTEVQSLLATKENLAQLGIKVAGVTSSNELSEIWPYLQGELPHHSWDPNPYPRQERYFRVLEESISRVKDGLSLDDAAIERLTKRLKRRMKEQQRAD